MKNNSLKCNKCGESALRFTKSEVCSSGGVLFAMIDIIKCDKCGEEYSQIDINSFAEKAIIKLNQEITRKEAEIERLKLEVAGDRCVREELLKMNLEIGKK